MAEPEFVNVGRVGRPHGLDGSFVVERPSEDESHFRVGAVLYAGGKPAEVVAAKRVGGRRLAVKLDRRVERGTELAVPRAELPELGEVSLYVFQFVGLSGEEVVCRTLGNCLEV